MKFLTVFAFACVASFVVIHGVYGSPVPAPAPEPSPVANPAPKADPVASPEPVANTKPVGVSAILPGTASLVSNSPQPAGADANFVALSANAEPMVPAPEAAPLKMDEAPADTLVI